MGISTSVDSDHIVQLGRNVPQSVPDSDRTVNDSANNIATAAKTAGYDKLLKEHIDAWEAIWASSSITVENARLQSIINSAQYELLSSTYPGARASIPPGGLAGVGYGGMIFCDAETWMMPYLLLTHPQLAKSIIDYRFDNLPEARVNVTDTRFNQDRGIRPLRGAYFPWVSGTGAMGSEAGDGVRGRRQLHLQADIALAQHQYYAATGDRAFLQNQAWPILSGIADFYTTRVTLTAGGYDLEQVTAPDEYVENVNTEAFTNGSAIKALDLAIEAGKMLNETIPPLWTTVRDNFVKPIERDGIHLEYSTFSRFNENNRIKQADVVLLKYPMEYPMTDTLAGNDLQYYASITDPDGPSMTDAVYAVVTAELGSCDFDRFLGRSYDVAMGPYHQFNETRVLDRSAGQQGPTNIFVTGAGGFLQGVGMGMTGYRFRDDRIVVKPILPTAIEGQPATRVFFKGLKWQGREFNVDIGATDTWVTLTKGDAAPVQTGDNPDELVTVTQEAPLKIPTRKPVQFNADGTKTTLPCPAPQPSSLMRLQ
ncbi:glycosyl hydrolase family 65 protein [Phyllobacterium zundukense]|uniref:glycosyl hydrolase family 65 protein n=1 Tax=Phyllobacterium zundukense TaxID=1867719 RepID=UPI000C3D2607|nr:glycosyl hydrolase family 65 protein [Phyllobacterium zundukense]ATU91641.1 hypothetical protein BLM14_08370 [Phyllobacterium zundukense]